MVLPMDRGDSPLSIDVQIIGSYLEGSTVLDFAAQLERGFGGFRLTTRPKRPAPLVPCRQRAGPCLPRARPACMARIGCIAALSLRA